MYVRDLIARRDEGDQWVEAVETFTPHPLPIAELQIARAHVINQRVAEDAIERRRLINLLALASDHNRKLGLVIYLRANRGQHDGRVVCAERVGQFREDERR